MSQYRNVDDHVYYLVEDGRTNEEIKKNITINWGNQFRLDELIQKNRDEHAQYLREIEQGSSK